LVDNRIRVIVESADYLSVAGLTSCLESTPEITLLNGAQRVLADVVVVAATALTATVVAELRRAAAMAPVPVVLVLNEISHADAEMVETCRVAAMLPRANATGDRLVGTVRTVAAGRRTTRTNRVAELLDHVRQETAAPGEDGRLTGRELDVLRLMADGLDTAEIASMLSYSERTIKSVFYGLTARLNLRNRPHAVAYALRKGLI
jgi:DNA-binding NarL/FixJ family response regulator